MNPCLFKMPIPILHDLLVAKIWACVLDSSSLRLLIDYFNSRKLQTKEWRDYARFYTDTLTIQDIINNLAFVIENSDIFADDNTLYSCRRNCKLYWRIWNMILVNICTGLKSFPRKQTEKRFNSQYFTKHRVKLKNIL